MCCKQSRALNNSRQEMTKPVARLGKPLRVLPLLPPKDAAFASAPGHWMRAGVRDRHSSWFQGSGGPALVPELVLTDGEWQDSRAAWRGHEATWVGGLLTQHAAPEVAWLVPRE